MPSPTAKVTITADDRATRKLRKVSGELKDLGKTAAKAGAGIAIGLAGAGVALTALSQKSLETADNIGKTADKLGLGVEALQEYRFAAGLSGIEVATFDKAIEGLGRRLSEADQGTGTAVGAFEELGISARNSAGQLKTVEEILPELADQFSGVDAQVDRVRLAMEVFGRSGAPLVNLLREQADGMERLRQRARDAGIVLSDDLVRGAEAANDELSITKQIVDAQFTRAFVELAPQIALVSKEMATLAIVSGKALNAFGSGLGFAIGELTDGGNTLVEQRLESIESLVGVERQLTVKLRRARTDREKEEIEDQQRAIANKLSVLRESLDDPEFRRLNTEGILIRINGGTEGGSRPDPLPLPPPPNTARGSRAKGLSDEQKALNKLLQEGASLTESLLEPQERYSQQLARLDVLLEKEAISTQTASRARAEYKQQLDDATGVTERFARLQEVVSEIDPVAPLLDQLEALEELQAAYPQYADIVGEAMLNVHDEIDQVNEGIDDQVEKTKEVEDAWQQLGPTFSSAFEDAIVEGDNLRDVLGALEDDILRIATRKLVTEPLGNAVAGIAGSVLSSFAGGGGGGAIPGFATGGSILPSGSGGTDSQLVMFRKTPNERVDILTPRQQRSGGGTVVNNHFSFTLPGDSVDHRQTGEMVARETARRLSLGGGLA